MNERKVSIDNYVTWCKEMIEDMSLYLVMTQAVQRHIAEKKKNGRRTILSNIRRIVEFFTWRIGYLERKLAAVEDAKRKPAVKKAFEEAVTILKEDEEMEE